MLLESQFLNCVTQFVLNNVQFPFHFRVFLVRPDAAWPFLILGIAAALLVTLPASLVDYNCLLAESGSKNALSEFHF